MLEMSCRILITGASTGFGAVAARQLALAGHLVFAGMYIPIGDVTNFETEATEFGKTHGVDLRPLQLDLLSEQSVRRAVEHITGAVGGLDVVIHNAGRMGFGFAESFTPEQYLQLYNVCVVGPVRLNAAVLPSMRSQRKGYIIWISSSSVYGGKTPLLGPYFAAKAGMESLAQTYARELNPWGIETTIVTPGLFTKGTSHFQNGLRPALPEVATAYDDGPTKGTVEILRKAMPTVVPDDADPVLVADALAKAIASPRGKKPFRLFVDPAEDGTEAATLIIDRIGNEFYRRVGLGQLLQVSSQRSHNGNV